MNFDFPAELLELKQQARRLLQERESLRAARRVLDGEIDHDAALWRTMIELGWTGAALPENFGGAGLGPEALCVLADEFGYGMAATPFSSSIHVVGDAILTFGSEEQRRHWLPRLISGDIIASFAFGDRALGFTGFEISGGRAFGAHGAVPDGGIADFCLLPAIDSGQRDLYLVSLTDEAVTREPIANADPSRRRSKIRIEGALAEPLRGMNGPADPVPRLFDRAAVYFAFEQIGGAQACLDAAVAYAKERHAFGRAIGSFQAIKHRLADIYAVIELARSNAFYAASALSRDAAELPHAAAAALLASRDAYRQAARENIQVHGGMGFTWEADCHLHYRRAQILALELGRADYWENSLIDHLLASGS